MKARADCFTPIPWVPLTGLLDNRSQPDVMQPFSFRKIQNWRCTDRNKLCRSSGWDKLFTKLEYNNEDYHDQLLALQTYYDSADDGTDPQTITTYPNAACTGSIKTRSTGRQPFTMGFEAVSTTGTRRLIVATESRISVNNKSTGNWKIIADGYGQGTSNGTCPRRRFYATQNLDVVLFTNNYDRPIYWTFDHGTFGCGMQAVSEIPDLAVIGLSKAAVTWTWRGVTFLADVEMDGLRHEARFVWSNYQDPLSWDPAKTDTIAGYQDLEYGEKILGGLAIGDVFLIYTNKRIWTLQGVGGDEVFRVTARYEPENKEACLFYRNTLTSIGDTHFYAGSDGLYEYDLYAQMPRRVDWIHYGTKLVFDDILSTCCDNPIAEYYPGTKELFFSWPQLSSTSCCNSMTLRICVDKENGRQHVGTIDHGFTMFVVHSPDDRTNVRDWIIENCICTGEQMNAMGYGYIKEGLPLADPVPTCTPRDAIYTNHALEVPGNYGYYVEDFTYPDYSYYSLCNLLGDTRLDDLCNLCETTPIFVMASSQDWCLKQLSESMYRERCVFPNAVGSSGDGGYTSSVGTYTLDGYDSILVPAPMNWGDPTKNKEINLFHVELDAALAVSPGLLRLRVGQSEQIVDTNSERCALLWSDEDPIELECQGLTAAQHAEEGTRPDQGFGWPVRILGKWTYWELKITGTGGACCLSRVTQSVKMLCR